MGKTIKQVEDAHVLHEPEAAYSVHLEGEKAGLSYENTVYFDESAE